MSKLEERQRIIEELGKNSVAIPYIYVLWMKTIEAFIGVLPENSLQIPDTDEIIWFANQFQISEHQVPLPTVLTNIVKCNDSSRYFLATKALEALNQVLGIQTDQRTIALRDNNILEYCREVERLFKECDVALNIFTLQLLESNRVRLGRNRLSSQDVREVIQMVVYPYSKYALELLKYEQDLTAAVNQQYPFNEATKKHWQEVRSSLKLKDKDIDAIELIVLPDKKAEYERLKKEEQRLVEEQQKKSEYERFKKEEQRLIGEQQPEDVDDDRLLELENLNISTQKFDFETAKVIVKPKIFGLIKIPVIEKSWKKARVFKEDLGNGVMLTMVAIPWGNFTMGSPSNEKGGQKHESPQHPVSIQPFFIGKYPVTQGQWLAVAGLPKIEIDLNPDPSKFKGINRPVDCVSWHEAREFCARLSHKTGKKYRLPSEAEWEYACRAGTTTPFYFGETITTDLVNYDGNYRYGAGLKGKRLGETTDVGSFPANAFGLYDMHGNVYEWCLDDWHNDYQGVPLDGSAWINSQNNEKVLRGGSWDFNPGECRSASRMRESADRCKHYIGFRVVCCVDLKTL